MNGPQHIEVWNNCLQMIKGVIQPKQYETWFEPIKPVSLVGSTFTIEVPSEFFREYLEAHYISFLSRALRKYVGNDARLMYKVQIFQEVLPAVVEEMEVEQEQILSGCKQEEVVDARSLLIKLMNDKGLYPVQISKITGINIRSVTQFLLGFKERINSRKILRINYERLKNQLGIS